MATIQIFSENAWERTSLAAKIILRMCAQKAANGFDYLYYPSLSEGIKPVRENMYTAMDELRNLGFVRIGTPGVSWDKKHMYITKLGRQYVQYLDDL